MKKYHNLNTRLLLFQENASMAMFCKNGIVSNRLVVVVVRSLPRNRGMVEDYGATEAGQLFRAWTRGRREAESLLCNYYVTVVCV